MKVLYDNEKTNVILNSMGIKFGPNNIFISEKNFKQLSTIIMIIDNKTGHFNYYELVKLNGNIDKQEITDRESINFLNSASQVHVGYNVLKNNYDRTKPTGTLIDLTQRIVKEFGGFDLFEIKNNKLLKYPGEGFFNLADNDVAINYISKGRVYNGYLDGMDYYNLLYKLDNDYDPRKHDISLLNNITTGKGTIIFITITFILFKVFNRIIDVISTRKST